MKQNDTTGNSGKILIVDDEGDICYLLSTFFKSENYETEQVNTLEQARIHLKENPPDLIFLDNHLPDGQGIKEIDQIRQEYPHTRIVVISAHDRSSDKALKSGADMFIPKPFTKEQVKYAVHYLLKQAS
jgi:DNA-binding response OmpR family regulator